MNKIEEAWLEFRDQCVPKTTNPEIQNSMRQIFMAGAMAMHIMMFQASEPDDENLCMERMDKIRADVDEIISSVIGKE